MNTDIKIKSALISVFHKDGLGPIVETLHNQGVRIFSTGGTETFIRDLGIPVVPVEDLTSYPAILGGRVKTLHPKIFGGILGRRFKEEDREQMKNYAIPEIDLVIVDLYPFEKTVAQGGTHEEIIEKIDIGGISLIRAAAKNFKEVLCISSMNQYADFLEVLKAQEGSFNEAQRRQHAAKAFQISSSYDTAIFNYMNEDPLLEKPVIGEASPLRYGENPHQKGLFVGKLDELFDKLHGKELSYNNLLDVDAAVQLMEEFKNDQPTFAILKHNNACGLATRANIKQAYIDALAGDPTSAFGGVLIANRAIDLDTAEEIHNLFCEVVIAPSYSEEAFALLSKKKNRIILVQKQVELPKRQWRTALNGFLTQDKDLVTDRKEDLKIVTKQGPSTEEINDLLFASKLCKNTKSNTIVLAKDGQLLASGTGQTSRVDALNQAIAKAQHFGFNLQGAVMASDAFFPFPDCVEIAHNAGITAVIQPGGSIKDQLSIDYCNGADMKMVMTGTRHFKH
ncbi:MAG: bifunctional phosphoribosylaminoimidazolecarboxamide formyltransferase/IMP cyclohydrolase [Flavobacteriaceae bacterium]